MKLRSATRFDTAGIGRLHADSWRFAYRGALTDAYLDSEAYDDRLNFWQDRFKMPPPNQNVFVLLDGARLVGFASVYIADHVEYGSFLNNLHVAEDYLRRGYGTRLMSAVRDCCVKQAPTASVYLWVIHSNERAQSFYNRLGATFRDTGHWEPPGGGSALLHRLA